MKQLGLITFLIVWAGFLFLTRKWKGNAAMTFSQHAAQTKASQLYYFALFLVSLPLLIVFLFGWFIPYFHTPFIFGLIAAFAMTGMMVAATIPETTGKKVVVHRYAAFLMAVCFVPLLIIISLSSHFSDVVRFIALLSAAYQLFGIVLLHPTKGYHPKVLPLQASYIAVFNLTIIAATYLR